MVLIPGNLQNASKTCATANCHVAQLDRIQKSLMTTNSGIISVDKFLFDELKPSDSLFHIKHLGQTAADMHLKNKCATCHLGNEKMHYATVGEQSRGGGCLACHLNYDPGKTPNIKDNYHPQINLNVDNTNVLVVTVVLVGFQPIMRVGVKLYLLQMKLKTLKVIAF